VWGHWIIPPIVEATVVGAVVFWWWLTMVGLVIVTKVAKFEPFGLALAVGGGRRSALKCRIHFAKTVRQWL